MIVNLTQHPATPEQLAGGVVDLPASERAALIDCLTVDKLPSRTEIANRCAQIAFLAAYNGIGNSDDDPHPAQAMIGGACWMMATLESELLDVGIVPVYAFSVRKLVEQTDSDGSVRKVNIFEHAGFIPAQ